MKSVKFKTNINCNGCINSVSPFLNALDNIDLWSVDIDNPDKILNVELDDENEQSVVDAVKKAGYEIQIID
jgi:copper chaperone